MPALLAALLLVAAEDGGPPPFPPGDVATRAYVIPGVVRLGDTLALHVEVRHPPGLRVELPDTVAWGGLASAGTVTSTVLADGTPQSVVERFTFPLQAFALGDLTTPAMTLRIPGVDAVPGALAVPPLPVYVRKTLEDPAQEQARPVAPPVPLLKRDPRFLAWPPLLLLWGLLWALVWWLDQRRPAVPPEEEVVPVVVVPPHRVALQSLQALREGPLLAQGRTSELVDAVVQVTRAYLEAAYRVPVLELTTGEALTALGPALVRAAARAEDRRLGRLDLTLVESLLSRADQVKFAKAPATVADCARALEEAVQVVETTRPVGANAGEERVEAPEVRP
jgi:hypothetical protein